MNSVIYLSTLNRKWYFHRQTVGENNNKINYYNFDPVLLPKKRILVRKREKIFKKNALN